MFVGHYGVAFGAKPLTPVVPLWVYFIAVQWLDVVWSILVLLGIEKLHIVPGFTKPTRSISITCPIPTACQARSCCRSRSAPLSRHRSRASAAWRFW